MTDACSTLDQPCEDYWCMAHIFAENASMAHNKAFESAVIKIIGSNEALVTPTERISMIDLKIAAVQLKHASATSN